jgi:hypothetical protein
VSDRSQKDLLCINRIGESERARECGDIDKELNHVVLQVTINGEQFVRARVDDSVTAERINARARKKASAELQYGVTTKTQVRALWSHGYGGETTDTSRDAVMGPAQEQPRSILKVAMVTVLFSCHKRKKQARMRRKKRSFINSPKAVTMYKGNKKSRS